MYTSAYVSTIHMRVDKYENTGICFEVQNNLTSLIFRSKISLISKKRGGTHYDI